MTNDHRLEIATILKAINDDWAVVDETDEFDFLVFVNEDRLEPEFQPKKELLKEIVQLGLLINRDKGSAVRENYVHYEGNKDGDLKEITQPGSIVYSYRVTAKGQQFLRESPKILGQPVPKLKVAHPSAWGNRRQSEPTKVVIYDRATLKKMDDDIIEKATKEVLALLSTGANS